LNRTKIGSYGEIEKQQTLMSMRRELEELEEKNPENGKNGKV